MNCIFIHSTNWHASLGRSTPKAKRMRARYRENNHTAPAAQHYNAPTCKEIAILMPNEPYIHRDIILFSKSNQLKRICELHPAYDLLQYPLFFLLEMMDGAYISKPLTITASILPQVFPNKTRQLFTLMEATTSTVHGGRVCQY